MGRLVTAGAIAAVVVGLPAASTSAAGAYSPGRLACPLSDARITESSGVASVSWADDVIWTHNDSGDQPRFFAVNTGTCAVAAVYDVTGARAVDWEDMAQSGTTLFLGDIGDNETQRTSVTVYDLPEPDQGAPSGPVRPSATRTLTYPDGAHDAESLFVDPTTGRLAIVTKVASGESAAYLAPINGSGVMEKAAGVPVPSATGADATTDRITVRDYLSAYEWEVHPGDTLARALGRSPTPVGLPSTLQGEAIAYARDGSGLWTTSERQGSPVHFWPGRRRSRPRRPVQRRPNRQRPQAATRQVNRMRRSATLHSARCWPSPHQPCWSWVWSPGAGAAASGSGRDGGIRGEDPRERARRRWRRPGRR